jgi:cation:H+ antiporter
MGLTLLWIGAELLIRNASRFASAIGLSPIIIGLSIVSLGTSAPELVVSIVAAAHKNSGISIGNVVGSNIANIGLILGIGAVLHPMKIKETWIQREVIFMIVSTVVFFGLAYWGNYLGFVDGLILLSLLVLFLFYLIRFSANEISDFKLAGLENSEVKHLRKTKWKKIILLLFTLTGTAILILGSEITVNSGKKIAASFGLSDMVIGLTLVALGTSLPELATTIVAALRKEVDLIVGNVIGSNIFNLLLIGGIIPFIHSVHIDEFLFRTQLPILLFISVAVWPLMRIRMKLKRYEGFLLLIIYCVFIYLTF